MLCCVVCWRKFKNLGAKIKIISKMLLKVGRECVILYTCAKDSYYNVKDIEYART